jgi:hypothetical protein
MKKLLWPLAVLVVPAILAAAGLYLIHTPVPAPVVPSDATSTLKPAASPSPTITASGSPRPTPRQAARHRHRHTGPRAVVRAYYRDIDAREYAKAWVLINSGLATGQTYQQFVSGYACTGAEKVTKLSQSGHQVSFNLAVVNGCTAAIQYYTGTDTVRGGKIVAAHVTRTG